MTSSRNSWSAESLQAEMLSHVDHAWLRMSNPTNLMTINGVLVLDRQVSLEKVRSVLTRRLLPIERFRQRVVVGSGGRPRWETQSDFDLDHHVKQVVLPDPGDDATLQEFIGTKISSPLDRSYPLWDFHLVENYRGGSAIYGRLHHCIGDGIVLMLVLLSLTDLEPETEATEETPSESRSRDRNPFLSLFDGSQVDPAQIQAVIERVMPEGVKLLTQPVEALRRTNRVLTGGAAAAALARLAVRSVDPATVYKGELGVEKRVAWSESVPLTEVIRLRGALGGTLNDILLTAMTGGLRRYMNGRGDRTRGVDFRAAVPVNLRPLEQMADLGNRFGLVFLNLPIGISDPIERLNELRRRMASLKRSAESVVIYGLLNILGRSPSFLQNAAVSFLGAKTTAVMTSVPGPQETIYFGGAAIRDIFFWVPQSGRVGLGVSICSYAGGVRLGVLTDAGLVPEPQQIVDGFHRELETMGDLASDLTAEGKGS